MNNPKFSHGSWLWNAENATISDKYGTPIATVYGASIQNNISDTREPFANARLIENAPEMFQLLFSVYSDIRNGLIHDVQPDTFSDIAELLNKICTENDEPFVLSLKPCPFCGNPNPYVIEYAQQFAVECPECQCDTRLCDTEQDAVNAWNYRNQNSLS